MAESLVTLAPDARMLSHGRIGIYSYGYFKHIFPRKPSNRQAENGLARSAPLRGFGLHLGNRPQQKLTNDIVEISISEKRRHGIGLGPQDTFQC